MLVDKSGQALSGPVFQGCQGPRTPPALNPLSFLMDVGCRW